MKKAFLIILLAGCIKLLWQLFLLLWVLRHPVLIANDATVYLSLGRGLVNGLSMYKDIFEIKPPGIFLLSALSIFVSGGHLLALAIQMMVYVTIPLFFVWTSKRQKIDVLLALIFGLSIAIFAADRTNGLQPEAYGTFFSLMFLLCTLKKRTILSAFMMLAAIWMKEPFLLSIFAAILILAEDMKFIRDRFLYPLLIAGITAIALLIITNTFHDYFFTYLSEIFSGRLQFSREFGFANRPSYFIAQPLWLRGLMFPKLTNEWPWLWFIMPLFLFGSYYLKKSRKKWIPLGMLAFGLGLFLFRRIDMTYNLIALMDFKVPLYNSFFLQLLTVNGALLFLFSLCLGWLFMRERKVFLHTVFLLIAVYLTTLAVSVGGTFNWHHFAFATPAYISVFLLFQRSEEKGKVFFALLIALMIFTTPKISITKRIDAQAYERKMTTQNQQYAKKVDALMDQCEYKQYMLWIKDLNIAAFTKHSPQEFYYVQLAGFAGYSEGPILKWKERYLASLHKTPIFITDDVASIPADIQAILDKEFTSTPPNCAVTETNVHAFFRK